jgi:hypothetical protein
LSGGKEIKIMMDAQAWQVFRFGTRHNGEQFPVTEVQTTEASLSFHDTGQIVRIWRFEEKTMLGTLARYSNREIPLPEG